MGLSRSNDPSYGFGRLTRVDSINILDPFLIDFFFNLIFQQLNLLFLFNSILQNQVIWELNFIFLKFVLYRVIPIS